ncbi:MAG: (d)CMP kinase [Calditrichaeota bacterium]|nr:MAG: (d)CMP kinase [Calditrichota bacterium]
MKRRFIIAIDGPAGSGKSTTAREVAKRLGFLYIDSGAIYRAITLEILKKGINIEDTQKVKQIVENTKIEVESSVHGFRLMVNGEDVTEAIRSPQVSAQVSLVSENAYVREMITQKQRDMADDLSVVVEGRDIGTVVFPDADLKIYMDASVEERAQRRFKELRAKGYEVTLKDIMQDITSRDARDSSRALSPLKKAEDAILIDTTHLNFEQQVDLIVQLYLDYQKKKKKT